MRHLALGGATFTVTRMSAMTATQTKITILSNTEMSKYDGKEYHTSELAWKLSRSFETKHDLESILQIDTAVNELATVTFNLECTMLEQEIFASARNSHIWSRNYQIDDPTQWIIPDAVQKHVDIIELTRRHNIMLAEKNKFKSQDEYRLYMPLSCMTSFTTTMNIRSLTKMIQFFHRLSHVQHLQDQFQQTRNELERALIVLCGSRSRAWMLIETMPEVDFLPLIKTLQAGTIGDFVIVATEIPIALRSDLIQHRLLQFRDSFKKIILNSNVWNLPLNTKVLTEIAASKDTWQAIISKRLCWLSHYELWKPILSQLEEIVSTTHEKLPCSSEGICPYAVDAELQYMEKGGLPCPEFAYLQNLDIEPSTFNTMQDRAKNLPSFWTRILNMLEKNGYVNAPKE